MKRVVIDHFGGLEVLEVVEDADPRPGPGEVRVRREAALQELHDRHASELWRFAMRLTMQPSTTGGGIIEVQRRAARRGREECSSRSGRQNFLDTPIRTRRAHARART
jgi:hypothetical protein